MAIAAWVAQQGSKPFQQVQGGLGQPGTTACVHRTAMQCLTISHVQSSCPGAEIRFQELPSQWGPAVKPVGRPKAAKPPTQVCTASQLEGLVWRQLLCAAQLQAVALRGQREALQGRCRRPGRTDAQRMRIGATCVHGKLPSPGCALRVASALLASPQIQSAHQPRTFFPVPWMAARCTADASVVHSLQLGSVLASCAWVERVGGRWGGSVCQRS